MYENNTEQERAILVSAGEKGGDRDLIEEYLGELEQLADTAGATVVDRMHQELEKPNPKTLIGKGKVEELKELAEEKDVKLVIFDDDLTPVQLRNLENQLQVKVIDRSMLILDIFARHARTNEAKTQVELAQLQYMLPRLTRMWTHLSKQYGGIGTKGPGETQIETDRRVIREKIKKLKEKLELIGVQKEQQKKGRQEFPRFALVGYTNAGKSTLMNTITQADVYVEDKLFATLDTTVRSFLLPTGKQALISDTVGFIRKLPPHLVASFRSTLTEASDADIIVHVVDISNEFFKDHIDVVNETLEYLKIKEKPQVLVFNKIDCKETLEELKIIEDEYANSIFVSARRGINITGLLELMQKKYDEQSHSIKILLPYSRMGSISTIYTICDIASREDTDEGILLELTVKPDKMALFMNNFAEMIVEN